MAYNIPKPRTASMIHVTADHHFGHDKIIEYENRIFPRETHDFELVERWNRNVMIQDWVIHLGDFSLCSPEITINLCRQLNGSIILINGNHDHRTRTFWEDRCSFYKWFKRPQYIDGLWLTHRVDNHPIVVNKLIKQEKRGEYPPKIRTGKLDSIEVKADDIVLHGHMHGATRQIKNFINVGVDAWNYFPVPLWTLVGFEKTFEVRKWIDDIS